MLLLAFHSYFKLSENTYLFIQPADIYENIYLLQAAKQVGRTFLYFLISSVFIQHMFFECIPRDILCYGIQKQS